MSFAPLNALAARLGEETVLAMARAYIEHVTEKRAGIPPIGWLQTKGRLWRETLNASVDKLDSLIFTIEQAEDEGIPSDDEAYLDALSRLEALQALRQMGE
jgi:hypothetical protein